MLNAALAYAEKGWRVHPLIPKDKKPLIAKWQEMATADAIIITEWWTKWPSANIGIATGEGSGFFVLDVDGEKGSRSLTVMENEIGPIPETLEAKTGTGGRHLLLQMATDREIRNKQNFMPGLDIRGEGGYIMVAPSIHPNGRSYEWPYGIETAIAEPPVAFLGVICPIQQEPPIQEPVSRPPDRPGATPVIERASLYLQECEPATQGAGGHDALLWAARALMVGFELSRSDALSLLWNDFNPRCSPPWSRAKGDEIKDFERKVDEVLRTPGQKPRGWLLDECGLRSDDEAMAALGNKLRDGLLASIAPKPVYEKPKPEHNYIISVDMAAPKIEIAKEIAPPVARTTPKFVPFPMDVLPPKSANYGVKTAEAHCVDLAFTGLPILVVASAAMGNAFRLRLKEGFDVPPTLWGGIVAASGSNKSGPLRAITAPLRVVPSMEHLDEDTLLLNPQARLVMSDATLEAVVAKLAISPRGLCTYRNELAGWVKSFNAYKKGGGDEQAWIEFWDAHEYQLDRKTNAEEVSIASAAVSVIGGIQPKVLVECFDPGKFASGLVPRLLIAHPPQRRTNWTDSEVDIELQKEWHENILWLRTRPFASLDSNTSQYVPHVLSLTPTAQARYIEFFDQISNEIMKMDEMSQTFASKSRVIAARLALCIHGLQMAELKSTAKLNDVSLEAVEAGSTLARWFLNEQVRVYGLASAGHDQQEMMELIGKIKADFGGAVSVRSLQRSNGRRYTSRYDAKQDLDHLVAAGLGTWDAKQDKFTVNQ